MGDETPATPAASSSCCPLPSPRCPVCATPVDADVRRCERCDTPHHPECWDYLGGCGIFGCTRAEGARILSSSSSSSSSPSPFPAPLPFHVADLADAVRAQSRALSLVAKGLLAAFFLPILTVVATEVATAAGWYALGPEGRRVVEAVGFCLMTGAFVAGLVAAAWGFGAYAVASLAGRRAAAAVTESLGSAALMGGRDRGMVLARLDLDEGDRAMVAAGGCAARLAWAFGGLGALVAVNMLVVLGHETGGMDLPFMAWIDLGAYGNGLLMAVISMAFTVAALRRLAALRLVDLQVTLNRVEAAGKAQSPPRVDSTRWS